MCDRSFLRRFLLAFVFLLLAATVAAMADEPAPSALSNVTGAITTDTTWTAGASPYVVTGDVTINPGVTLVIQPVVVVRFAGNYALVVRGALEAQGTAAAPIRFTSGQTAPAAGDWAMIDVRSDSQYALFEHAIIEYGGNASRAGVDCVAGALCAHLGVHHGALHSEAERDARCRPGAERRRHRQLDVPGQPR
ncbi:MAG: hypothetical protein FJZ90_03835 [Chloroflexi bacterium]|nr:hypothetical protein [Chloroflexota bacterium]